MGQVLSAGRRARRSRALVLYFKTQTTVSVTIFPKVRATKRLALKPRRGALYCCCRGWKSAVLPESIGKPCEKEVGRRRCPELSEPSDPDLPASDPDLPAVEGKIQSADDYPRTRLKRIAKAETSLVVMRPHLPLRKGID